MRYVVLGIVALLSASFWVHALEPKKLQLSVAVELSNASIYPGEPLYVYLSIDRGEDGADVNALVSFTSLLNLTRVSIRDAGGELMPGRPKEPWREGALGFSVSRSVGPGAGFVKTLIVQQWCATDLPPGDYTVHVEIDGGKVRPESDRLTEHGQTELRIRETLQLSILDSDPAKVLDKFEMLLEQAASATASLEERMLATDSILLSQGSGAFEAQLKLLENLLRGNIRAGCDQRDAIKMLWPIIQAKNSEFANRLVEFAQQEFMDDVRSGALSDPMGIVPVVAWAVHESLPFADPKQAIRAEKFLAENPVSPAFVDRAFMHGGGIRPSRDY